MSTTYVSGSQPMVRVAAFKGKFGGKFKRNTEKVKICVLKKSFPGLALKSILQKNAVSQVLTNQLIIVLLKLYLHS